MLSEFDQQRYKTTTPWRMNNIKVLQVLKFISPLFLELFNFMC